MPVYNSDYDALRSAKLKEGDIFEIEIKKKRNYEFHKKYFALVNLCFDNQEVFETLDEMRFYLTMKSGFYKTFETEKGKMYMPKSISFSEMDNIEFQTLYNNTINAVCEFLNTDSQSLLDEIVNYI